MRLHAAVPSSTGSNALTAKLFSTAFCITHETAQALAAREQSQQPHALALAVPRTNAPHTTRTHHSSKMTADNTASKAEEYVLLGADGDPEKTTALPDLPVTNEPADKRKKTIVADATGRGGDSNKQDETVEASHAATYEAALKEAAPDAPPSVGDAAAALKDATLRELGAAREKASTKIKAAARAARRNAPAWRRVGRWALGLLALAFVFAGGFFLGERRGGRRSVVTSAPVADTASTSANPANALANHVPPTDAPANEPPADVSSTNDASPTCRTRPSADSLFDNIVNDILGLRSQPRPRRAEPLDAFVRRMLSPAPRMVPTMDVSFGWPGLELTVPFLQDERAARDRAVRQEQHQRLVDPLSHQAAQVQQRRLEEQRRLEHARQEAARAAQVQQRRLEENARRQAAHRRAQTAKATAIQKLEERLAKAEAAREQQRRVRTDVVETAAVDAEPAVEPTPAPTRPARDALRELSIKQLRNILAARGGAPCTTCKEKDDLVAAVMAVLDD